MTVMVGRYAPLVLPGQLNVMPTDYASKIVIFDNTSVYTAQQYIDRMSDVLDLQEVDEADHKIDNLVRVVNQMMQRVNLNDQNQARENQNLPQTRNQRFRRNVPQIKQREQKGPD